jgi:hypothetical protein
MRAFLTSSVLAAFAMGTPVPVAAQPAAPAGRIELAGGVGWIGRSAFGSQDANETTSSAGTLRLFGASTELAAAPDVEARFAVRLTRAIDLEANGSYGRPELRIRIQNDSELTAAPAALRSSIHQFTAGGDVVVYPGWSIGSRGRAFVSAGAAYVRQLENDGALIVSGLAVDAGGGVKWLLASRAGRLKGLGVRVDARALVRRKGVALDDRMHISPAVGGSVFLRF